MQIALALGGAASVAVVLIGMIDGVFPAAGPRSATAAAADTIRRAVAVRYTLHVGGTQVRILEDGNVVREERADGIIMIRNRAKGTLMELNTATKMAVAGTIVGDTNPSGESLLAYFRDHVVSGDGEFVGRERVGDIEAEKYRFSSAEHESVSTVWIDPGSQLPIKVQIAGPSWLPGEPATIDQCEWNPAFDRDDLAVAVPSGYTLARDERREIRTKTQTFAELRQDLTNVLADGTNLTSFLSLYAERFQGAFPEALDPTAAKVFGAELNRPTDEEIQRLGRDAQQIRFDDVSDRWARCLELISSLERMGRGMHYLGKGRARNDGRGIIAWWQTFAGDTYIAVYDDLSFKEVPASELLEATQRNAEPL